MTLVKRLVKRADNVRKQETVKLILTIALAIMTAVAGFSAYKIITISQEYHKEEEIHKQIMNFCLSLAFLLGLIPSLHIPRNVFQAINDRQIDC